MDKREEDFNDSDNSNELPEIPETLRGDPIDKSAADKIEKVEETVEETKEAVETEQIEKTGETDDSSVTDPELESALSELTDETEKDENTVYISENGQSEIPQPVKPEKSGLIKRILIVAVIAVVLIGGGLFLFWQLNRTDNTYIMKFDGQKISMEEFKFYLLMSQQSQTPKDDALSGLTDQLIFEKAAKEKNIVLSQEEKDNVKAYIDEVINSYNVPLNTLKISSERLEALMSLNDIYYKLIDKVAEEKNFTVDETALATEFANFKNTDKLLKYIILNTQEEADQVKSIIASGSLSIDEIIKQYSTYYDATAGIEKVSLSQIGLPEADSQKILALKESEYSDVINLGGIYGIFFVVTDSEAEDYFRQDYISYQKYQLFQTEYQLWKNDAKITVNQKAMDNFDEKAFYTEFFPTASPETGVTTDAAAVPTT